MEAYKPYVEYLMANSQCETAYILTRDGAICGTNLPIQEMPRYEFELEDEADPTKTSKVVMDEKANLLEALRNKGVCTNKAGIRLYNQKYYMVSYDEELERMLLRKVRHPLRTKAARA